MSTERAVTIVIPTQNVDRWVSRALESCIKQTLTNIEIICVDNASTDATRAVVESFRARDPRVRLIPLDKQLGTFLSRRAGVEAASGSHVVFLDAYDELEPSATLVLHTLALQANADLVGFGVNLLAPASETHAAPPETLPRRDSPCTGEDILDAIYPPGRPAHGTLRGYFFATDLLRRTYSGLPQDLHPPVVGDLSISLLAVAGASAYISTGERLYRQIAREDTHSKPLRTVRDLESHLEDLHAIEAIEEKFRETTQGWADPAAALACYESARLWVLGSVLRSCVQTPDEDVQRNCIALLQERVGYFTILGAAAGFCAEALPLLVLLSKDQPVSRSEPRHVLLTTAGLSTGGLEGVVVSQAQYLLDAGLRVTVVLHRSGDSVYELPAGARVICVEGTTPAQKLSAWVDICRESGADVMIDHHIFYNRQWPFRVLAARAFGIAAIGCLQTFALRPLLDDNDTTSFMVANLPLLQTVTTLSATDVAYWKMRGIVNVVSLPNPPSPMLLRLPTTTEPKPAPVGPFKLFWWGRLQESTKRVRSLIPIVAELRELGIDVELTIIGPDGPDLTAEEVRQDAAANGIASSVHLPGPLHGEALIDAMSAAHIYVSTSVVEGSPLALVEAQALGLPVAMYDLPWLANLEGNGGVITASQGDARGLARHIAELLNDPARYVALSASSLVAARKATEVDFPELYMRLLKDELSPDYSPAPSVAHAGLLLEWAVFYSEANSRHHAMRRTEVNALRHQSTRLRAQVGASRDQVAALRKKLAEATQRSPRLRRLASRARRRVRSLANWGFAPHNSDS